MRRAAPTISETMADKPTDAKPPFKPKPPDYNVSCALKQDAHDPTKRPPANNPIRGIVGAAWKNEDGTIKILMNPFVVLPPGDKINLVLFPIDYKPKDKSSRQPPAGADATAEEVPF